MQLHLCPYQKTLWLLVQPTLHKKFNFIVGFKSFSSYGLFEWPEEVKIAWCQDRTLG
jgi:hypothetical protein